MLLYRRKQISHLHQRFSGLIARADPVQNSFAAPASTLSSQTKTT
jgi:hypothetical protein